MTGDSHTKDSTVAFPSKETNSEDRLATLEMAWCNERKRWLFRVCKPGYNDILVTAAQLFNYKKFRVKVFEQVGRLLPPMAQAAWEERLEQMIERSQSR